MGEMWLQVDVDAGVALVSIWSIAAVLPATAAQKEDGYGAVIIFDQPLDKEGHVSMLVKNDVGVVQDRLQDMAMA